MRTKGGGVGARAAGGVVTNIQRAAGVECGAVLARSNEVAFAVAGLLCADWLELALGGREGGKAAKAWLAAKAGKAATAGKGGVALVAPAQHLVPATARAKKGAVNRL